MPSERRPLFNPRLLAARLEGYDVPDPGGAKTAAIARWRATLDRGRLEKTKETQLQGTFLIDFFQTVLGYKGIAEGADSWTYAREETVPVDGKCADGVLGHFTDEHKTYVAAVELKGAATDLDTRPPGRHLTPLEQCYQYAHKLECNWIIVSNYREIRLYHKSHSDKHYEVFRLEDLAEPDELKRFRYLLCADHVVARKGASVIDRLLAETGEEEEKITHRLYAEYKHIRLQIFDALRRDNPGHDDHLLLEKAQKILDRVLFVCFCEDRGLLPHQIIDRAYEQQNPFAPVPIWHNFVGLFHAIDAGNEPLKIPGYNGGLFATDNALDGLTVGDEVCKLFRQLAHYDYAAEVNVDILGHIFEQSISDIENLKAEFAGEQVDRKKSKRKKEGVYYTPEYITRYIVEEAVGGYVKERFAELENRHDVHSVPKSHTKRRAKKEIELWEDYQDALKRTRVLDPACGSGAFLIQAFDYLAGEYERCNAKLTELRGHPELFDLNRVILSNNLYGVDINPEAVEITKLSLWIKTAERGKQLTYLDDNIQCGNSIVSPPKPAASSEDEADQADPHAVAFGALPDAIKERAFDWQAAFPGVFAEGGFDCVIGNPPYIRQEWLAPYKPCLQAMYECFSGTADLYLYFFERGLGVLKPRGRLGYITSGTFARANFAAPFRKWLPGVARFSRLVNFGENQPFEGAEMVYPTMSILVKDTTERRFTSLFLRGSIPDSIDGAVEEEGTECNDRVFQQPEWNFQADRVNDLAQRLLASGRPLGSVLDGRMYFGVKTGLNEAFIIDRETKDSLVAADAACAPILKKLVRGEDLRPWYQEDEGRWLIFARRGIQIEDYPSAKAHLDRFRTRLEPRPGDWTGAASWPGRKPGSYRWYELQDAVDYYEAFERPKVFWPDIAKLPRFSFDTTGLFVNDKGFVLLPPDPPWILAHLQSRLLWFCVSQLCVPLRLRGGLWQYQCKKQFIQRLPIVEPDERGKEKLAELALSATSTAQERYELHESVRHRILTDLAGGEGKLNQKLTAWWTIDFPTFRKEAAKALNADIPLRERTDWEAALQEWQNDNTRLTAQLVTIEEDINDRVYHLYGLSNADIQLLDEHSQHAMIDYAYGEP